MTIDHPRHPPSGAPPEQLTAQREKAVRALANRAHVRKAYRKRYPGLARVLEARLTELAREGAS
jgi:hypothetical protein